MTTVAFPVTAFPELDLLHPSISKAKDVFAKRNITYEELVKACLYKHQAHELYPNQGLHRAFERVTNAYLEILGQDFKKRRFPEIQMRRRAFVAHPPSLKQLVNALEDALTVLDFHAALLPFVSEVGHSGDYYLLMDYFDLYFIQPKM